MEARPQGLVFNSGVDGTRTRDENPRETQENKPVHAPGGGLESPGLATSRDVAQPLATGHGAISDAELAAAVAAAVTEKRWAIAEVLAAEVQRRQRERTPSNVVAIDDRRHRRP